MQPSIWCQQKLEINLTGHPICIVQPRQESEHVNRTISQPLSPPIHSPRAPRSCSRGRGRGSLRTRWRPCTCWGGRRGRRAAPASASTACSKYVRHHKKSVSGTRWGRGCHTGYRETGQTGRAGQCSPFGPFFHFLCDILHPHPRPVQYTYYTSEVLYYSTLGRGIMVLSCPKGQGGPRGGSNP